MRIIIVLTLLAVFCELKASSQEKQKNELNAQEILARVDNILAYPEGFIEGKIIHIIPGGKSVNIDVAGYVSGVDSFFRLSTRKRGEEIRILYNNNGEKIRVYNIHSITLFNLHGIDKFDRVLRTNFYYIDLSNYDLRSNYAASIAGDASVKGNDCYKLNLVPHFSGGLYGLLTIYVNKSDYVPLRIDFHDANKIIIKTMSIVKVAQKKDRIFPLRYDMLDVRKGTMTILEFYKFDPEITLDKNIFRHENLEDK